MQRAGKFEFEGLTLRVGRERIAYARSRAGALASAEKALLGAFASAGRANLVVTKCLRGGSLAVADHGLEGHRGPLKVAMFSSTANRVDFNEEKLLLMGIDGPALERANRAAARERWDL